jgi:hypothetical protein
VMQRRMKRELLRALQKQQYVQPAQQVMTYTDLSDQEFDSWSES